MTDITLEQRARDILQDEYQRTHAANPKCNLDEATWGLAHRAVTQALRLSAGADAVDQLDESEKDVALGQAVEFAEYVERQAKGTMRDAAKRFLSLPYAMEIAERLNECPARAAAPRHETGEG